ncbi:MAG: bifunctional phosphoribosyl-AMP cyclohydrolase/phosphoribosyl-ATP diphosphatase HisIE [Spirochaetaceae bacterium]|nr:bifunctional phosphoribosyl-AMP cyclohydrolase/phosphoribosyl-ATP diphosphatase HisIE [Spirochaetaceae bacterium]
MVIASIDIQNKKVVQLKQGKEFVLEGPDPATLIKEYDRYGEIAVIDIDAAMNKGSNIDIIKPLLKHTDCRVGGGIRTVEQAVELVSLGAKKVIIGSTAFKTPGKEGFVLNTDFLDSLAEKIGRERIIVAVDARDGKIVVDGWKTDTGLDLIETAKQVEKYAGEILYTCVEREGTMTGINLDAVKKLRASVSCLITVAGGVSSLDEIESIAALNCDVQLGMALYTGKINLTEAFIVSLNWTKVGEMIPVIVQAYDGQVLMTGYATKPALTETFKRGNLCFHSRTRDKLWMKGETSGNTLQVLRLRADCDRDALLAIVRPIGYVCHTGQYSCFETGRQYTLQYLQDVIKDRLKNAPEGSYTASLTDERVRRKVMEEAYEVCTAEKREEVIWEAADLFFHTMILMSKEGVSIDAVLAELDRRHKISN